MKSDRRSPDKIPANIDFAAQELLEAPEADRPVMLENIAKASADRAGDCRHKHERLAGVAER